jgi:hypothetical protein
MTDTIIKVENLCKRYRIRHERERYTALRDVIAEKAKNLFCLDGRSKLTSDVRSLPAAPKLGEGGNSDF